MPHGAEEQTFENNRETLELNLLISASKLCNMRAVTGSACGRVLSVYTVWLVPKCEIVQEHCSPIQNLNVFAFLI